MLSLPDIPCGKSLKEEHFEAVFDFSPCIGAALHECRNVGVVEQVVAEMVGGKEVVGNIRTVVDIGVHAQRGGVDDYLVERHDFGGQLVVSENARPAATGDELRLYAKTAECIAYGLR